MILFELLVKDIKKFAHSIICFMPQLILALFCLILVSTQYLESLSNIKILDAAKEYNVVNFTIEKSSNIVGNRDNQTKEISSILDDFNAYTWYLNDRSNIYYMYGNYLNLLPNSTSDDTKLIIGDNADTFQIDSLIHRFGIKKENIVYMSSIFDGRNGALSLDNSLVIVNGSNEFESLNYQATEQLFHNLHLFNVDEVKLRTVISVLNSEQHVFYPRNINDMSGFINMYSSNVMLLVYFIIAFVFIVIDIYISLDDLVEASLREYNIHRLFGATITKIILRFELIVTCVYLIPGSLLIVMFSKMVYSTIPWGCFFIILVTGQTIISIILLSKILKNDISNTLRRN